MIYFKSGVKSNNFIYCIKIYLLVWAFMSFVNLYFLFQLIHSLFYVQMYICKHKVYAANVLSSNNEHSTEKYSFWYSINHRHDRTIVSLFIGFRLFHSRSQCFPNNCKCLNARRRRNLMPQVPTQYVCSKCSLICSTEWTTTTWKRHELMI